MIWNTLLLALREIRRNLLRSFLTILGIVIGVAAVITMVTLGNGATKSISDQVSSLGSNLLMVRPGQRIGPGGSAGAPLFKIADVQAITAQVTGVKAVAPETRKAASVVVGSRNWSTIATGGTRDYFTAAGWTLTSGRIFTEAEERGGKAVCVIGSTIVRELFGGGDPLGEMMRVADFSCQVIGVLASKGQSAFGSDQDDVVIMPIRTVQRRLTGDQDVRTILVSAADGVSTDTVKERVEKLLRERRKIGDNEDDNFNVLDTKQIAEALSTTTRVMTTLLGAVAAVSLIVGGIGIMNIMLVSVTERTREIGIRLAIGALEHEVLLQFLIEAVVLSSLGGLIGIALATAASIGLSSVMNIPYLFNPAINLLSFAISAGIGVVFGFFPARRAAQLDPIDALRHE
ncbi:MAG: ABC transporter permease [Zoogloeaceae bacterium]|nr:ABC transporter permease [Rhodocyclaceae bacterium]MCP5231627.1 ABC transporter permease [Zoogloeaceae bacterium]MCP5253738.1 ABC transporter permease [Zoogloeaceae bacterium]MCP5293872.1 ABC transporter permease [Zoogloeaceae bacterium]